MSYAGTIQRLIAEVGPYFLHNKNIGTFLQSVAMVWDEQIQSLEMGLALGQPLQCHADALPTLSYDRGLRFYPGESEQSKRQRLSIWLQLHHQRATHAGEMRHEQPYFLPDTPVMRIVHQNGDGTVATWHTLDADGVYTVQHINPSNWNYDGATAKWWRFWVIVYPPSRFLTEPHYGDGCHYGDGTLYSGGATHDIAADLVNMILEWQSKHANLWGYIFATDPDSFLPDATPELIGATHQSTLPMVNWSAPIDADGYRVRNPTAFWLYDMGA
jgi:hypothetical protein